MCTAQIPVDGRPSGKRIFAPGGALAFCVAEREWLYTRDSLGHCIDAHTVSCYQPVYVWPSCGRAMIRRGRV